MRLRKLGHRHPGVDPMSTKKGPLRNVFNSIDTREQGEGGNRQRDELRANHCIVKTETVGRIREIP